VEQQHINVHIDRNKLIAPLCAGQMTTAFYAALILKKLEGKDLTEELREQTFHEVLELWGSLEKLILTPEQEPEAGDHPEALNP